MQEISGQLGLGWGSTRVLLGIAVCLTGAASLRGYRLLRRRDEQARGRWRSLLTWWVMFVLLVAVLILGRGAVLVAAAAISVAGLRESVALTGSRRLFPVAVLLAAALYLWAWWDWRTLFLGAFPVVAAALALGELAWRGWLRPRLAPTRTLVIAVLPAALGPASLVAVASLPAPASLPDESLGWLLLLIVLTGLNDMAQAWWGRPFGSRKMAPTLSPGKTWEGLVGGLVTTVAASVVLAPLLSDFGRALPATALELGPPWADSTMSAPPDGVGAWVWAAALGLVVGLAGVTGDLAVSALKRRAGVKDSGDLLPGQGGLLDRFDSLSITGPAFFVITWLLWFRAS